MGNDVLTLSQQNAAVTKNAKKPCKFVIRGSSLVK